MRQTELVPAEPAEPELRRRLCTARVTLEDRPAIIWGEKDPYATVHTLDDALEYTYDWTVVRRVVETDGKFYIDMRRL